MPKGVSPPKDRRHLVMDSKGSQRCDCRVDRYAVTRLIVARAHPRNSENVVEPKSDNQTEAPQGIVVLLPSHRPIRAGPALHWGTEPNFLAAEAFPTENRNNKKSYGQYFRQPDEPQYSRTVRSRKTRAGGRIEDGQRTIWNAVRRGPSWFGMPLERSRHHKKPA